MTTLWVQADIIEYAEHVVWVAGEMGDGQKQSSMALERSLPLLQQEDEIFRTG